MSIFDEMRKKEQQRQFDRQRIREQMKTKNTKEKSKEEALKELKRNATEFYTLLQDDKYPQYMGYLRNLRETLVDHLIRLNATGKEEQSLTSARISAQIWLIDIIIDYPVEIIKALENLTEK